MKILVLGATSGIAQATVRAWSVEEPDVHLVGRNPEKLRTIAEDLGARGCSKVTSQVSDLGAVEGLVQAVDTSFDAGPIDIVLIAFGTMPTPDELDTPVAAYDLLDLNGSLCLLATDLCAQRLLAQGSGKIAVIGSVAGDRGRGSNYLYGAAKAMVAIGVAGLQHRLSGSNIRVTLVKPGPTSTPMTDHLRGGHLKLAKATTVASDIVQAVDRGVPVVYTPRRWRMIMMVIRLIPRRLFERTDL